METQDKNQQTWIWIAVAAGATLIVVCLCVAVVILLGVGGFAFSQQAGFDEPFLEEPFSEVTLDDFLDETPEDQPGTPAEEAAALPPPTPIPSEPAEENLFAEELPRRDQYDLARRFLGVPEAQPPDPVTFAVGDVEMFYVSNDNLDTTVEVEAELVYMAENVYMWMESGVTYEPDDVAQSAETFSADIVPTTRSYFGMEPSPEIDGDPRLHILNSTELGTFIAGYFGAASGYPEEAAEYSNEKEMFFINIAGVPPGTDYYDSVLAHEFQHMIQWNVDGNEETWLNEGFSELSAYLNGYGKSGFTTSYLTDPDIQLTGWPEDGNSGAYYGGSYLFAQFFLDQFGQEALRELASNSLNGMLAVDDTLDSIGANSTANQLFVDWTVANLMNNPSVAGGRYAYQSLTGLFTIYPYEVAVGLPYDSDWRNVHQYGADYVTLLDEGPVTISFEGTQQVRVIPTDTSNTDDDSSTDDRFVWWSNRGDDSDAKLTRSVDLTGVEEATLAYDLWFFIEDLWDYGYVTVSVDGGETWEILSTPYTTTDDPHGNAYGPGYTGRSADFSEANAEGWVEENIDLGNYVGQEIQIRFELVYDDAVNQPGLAIDNLCIDAIDWCDDVESDADGWDSAGWIRHNNILRQEFSASLVIPGSDGGFEVVSIPLDETNAGTVDVTLPNSAESATLIVSGLTRYTTELATYRVTITE